MIKGTELNDYDKEDLKEFYEEFFYIYTSIIDEMLVVRYDPSGKSILPMDFSSIIGNIKNMFSSESSKKWNEKNLYEQIEWGHQWRYQYKRKIKITLLLAHIFALWTLMKSADFKNQ